MRRALLVVALLTGLVFLTPTAALACSCVQAPTATHVKRADTVFEATLAWSANNGVEATYGVNVAQVFKGTAASFEKLRSAAPNEVACELASPVTNRRYVFYVQGEHPGQMEVEACGGSEPSSDAVIAAVTAVTGASTEPVAAPRATAEAESTGLGTFGWIVIGGAAAVVAGLCAIALRTRFR